MKTFAFVAGLLGPWVWAAIAAVLVATHTGVGLWVRAEVTEHWQLRESEATAATQAAIAAEQRKQKQIGDRWQEIVEKVTGERDAAHAKIDQLEAEQAATTRRLDDAVRANGWMRNQLAAYAAGGTGADPGATCEARARALAALAADGAELLAEGAGLVRSCAAAHDKRAAEVNALVDAWPRNVTGPGDDG